MMTVGQLRAALAHLEDDVPVGLRGDGLLAAVESFWGADAPASVFLVGSTADTTAGKIPTFDGFDENPMGYVDG